MHVDRLEPHWIEAVADALRLAAPRAGEAAALLYESQSRPILVDLADHALTRFGVTPVHVRVPSPRAMGPIALRSTGASRALDGHGEAVAALSHFSLIVDCTLEGLLHAPARAVLLAGGARIFMLSDEHPEIFDRLRPAAGLQALCERGAAMITQARRMRVTSAAGSDLHVDLTDVAGRGSAGLAERAGKMGYWPAGLCLCYPKAGQ
jgi:2,5-dihydroxypyridine 5,6-dioxygenase